MTRIEFVTSVTSWPELLSFCLASKCCICENIVSSRDLSARITDDYVEYGYLYDWQKVRDWLNSIEDGAQYYYHDREGYFRFIPVDNEFERYKSEVLKWCECNYVFDTVYPRQ